MHSTRSHSALSASGASRWINCPGSVRMTSGLPGVESKYASEGTGAHELAQAALLADRDADAYLGQVFSDVTVTPEMARDVQPYIDTCRTAIDGCAFYKSEQQFTLEKLSP